MYGSVHIYIAVVNYLEGSVRSVYNQVFWFPLNVGMAIVTLIFSFFVSSAPLDDEWESEDVTSDPSHRDEWMEDFLLADDPAQFSDQFSDGESDWLDTY